MSGSTTIRVPQEFRERLRQVSERRHSTLTDTLVAALAALRREEFFDGMARWETELRNDPQAWAEYEAEAEEWAGDLDDVGRISSK